MWVTFENSAYTLSGHAWVSLPQWQFPPRGSRGGAHASGLGPPFESSCVRRLVRPAISGPSSQHRWPHCIKAAERALD